MSSTNGLNGRILNFSAGPSQLPLEILLKAQEELLNYNGSGNSVLELSHRSSDYRLIQNDCIDGLRALFEVPQTHDILLLSGGGSTQFASVPLNLLPHQGAQCGYAVTGSWSKKAFAEAGKFGNPRKVTDGSANNYARIDPVETWDIDTRDAYLYYCDNETIHGLEFPQPLSLPVPLVADMSSNFCTRPVDVGNHRVIFAATQKNAGAGGLTIVFVEKSCLGKELQGCPTMLSYRAHSEAKSLYNTPPCFNIYLTGLAVKRLRERGGLSAAMEAHDRKAERLYRAIDESNGFYFAMVADKTFRSRTNVVFQVGREEDPQQRQRMADALASEAKAVGMTGLGGHRSVGGLRASLYSGMDDAAVEKLVDFMKRFQEEHDGKTKS
eukprot:GHVU01146962.1.p1 GENE.GHVU01146962.1~~GHVU01146962.1.p1  ORF type:complete len:382 (+),score=55.92 GHVU01146962.1:90-1235(+)